ncbi:hypothetical protein [Spirosoma sp.]|uniref:hypothetical protein n=1 Tax=Spirosoma sp. TaxID=1899569 RepID=UPI000968FC7D|nr:hypothetical protein [Spirosoma sp.]MBN8824392.1 hypothetical protein [Spirosoma sp.]OJW70145.1 MAG: hypothetical protein BGO59_26080 [Spirosoma sp. 48-14]
MAVYPGVALLKQYIKTLVANDSIFPDVIPRQYGHEFSRAELQAIYYSLFLIMDRAKSESNQLLMARFKTLDEPYINLHWFLFDFWQELVPLITQHAKRHQLVLN